MKDKNLNKRIIVFLLVFSGCFGLLEYISITDKLNDYTLIRERINKHTKKEIVFFGSSHTAFGICDTMCNITNLGARNEPYLFTLKKIQLTQPKIAVVSLNVQNIQYNYNHTFEEGLLNVPQFEYLYEVLTDEERKDADSLMGFESYSFYKTKKIIPFIGQRFTKGNTSHLFGNWENMDTKSNLDSFRINKRFFDEFVKTNFRVSDFQIKYLYKLFEYCKANKIRLIIISTPLSKGFSKKIPVFSYRVLHSLIKDLKSQYDFIYYDYTFYPMEDKYFLDSDHLNGAGSVLFTRQLAEQFRRDGIPGFAR